MTHVFSLLSIRLSRLLGGIKNGRVDKKRKNRAQWDTSSKWYRLRYEDAGRAHKMIANLSSVKGGRIALRMRYDDMLRCWIGVPPALTDIIHKVATSSGCTLEETSTPPREEAGTFFLATAVPDTRTVDAYILNGVLFLSRRGMKTGEVFPVTVAEKDVGKTWTMPEPSLGITTQAHADLPASPVQYRREGEWLLGWDQNDRSVGSRQIGVLGNPDQVHLWLSSFLLTTWRSEGTQEPVVVIDGTGTWIDQFLKNPVAQALFTTRQVRVLDIRSHQLAFNPLAWADTERETAIRWFWWFNGMGVAAGSLKKLIPAAIESGVQSVPELYTWLKRNKASNPTEIVPLMDKIEKLDADPLVRDWLLAKERFVDIRQIALRTPLLVTPRLEKGANVWAKRQALRALLGLVLEVDASIILHQIHLGKSERTLLKNRRITVTNSPGNEATIITRCNEKRARQIHSRLGLSVEHDHLQLLPQGSSLVVHGKNGDSKIAAVSWRNRFE